MISDAYHRLRTFFENRSKTSILATTDTGKEDIATVRSANHTLFIQRVLYVPTTAHATALSIRDDAGTPLVIGTIPASQAVPYTADFGAEGIPLTAGKNLDLGAAGAGPAGTIRVEGYNKLTTAVSVNTRSAD